MDFVVFNVESIREFTSTFVAICSATSHLFDFPSISKRQTIDILKLLFTTLINKDNKVVFIRVDSYGSLERFSEFMKTCYNVSIIVQNILGISL